MSSCNVIVESGKAAYVVFAGGYKCMSPSIAEACQATDMVIDGIAGVVRREFGTRVFPNGRFCCGECGEWKAMDINDWAWAVRSWEDRKLINQKLICEECVDSDAFSEGGHFAVFAHEDMYISMRHDAEMVQERLLVNKWRKFAKHRKERREFALSSALVFKEQFDDRTEGWMQAWQAFMMCV